MQILSHFKTYLEVNVTRQNGGEKSRIHLTVSYRKLNLNLIHKKH